jgi:hypothetical protein
MNHRGPQRAAEEQPEDILDRIAGFTGWDRIWAIRVRFELQNSAFLRENGLGIDVRKLCGPLW